MPAPPAPAATQSRQPTLHRLSALQSIISNLTQATDLDAIFQAVSQGLVQYLGYSSILITRKIEDSHEIIYSQGVATELFKDLRKEIQALNLNQHSMVLDSNKLGKNILALTNTYAAVATPITFSRNVYGYIIALSNTEQFALEKGDIELLGTIAYTTATSINGIEFTKKIHQEHDKTQSIIESLIDGLLFFDDQQRLTMMNPRASEICDTPIEKILGLTPDTIPSFQKNLLKIMQSLPPFKKSDAEPIKGIEVVLDQPYSQTLQVSLTATRGQSGKNNVPTGYLIVLHDITKEKMVDQMKSEFVSVASHQLRTPLAAIKWTLEMFRNGDLGELTNEQKEFIEKSFVSNERMITLVDDLLNISRIEEGILKHSFTNVVASDYLGTLLFENRAAAAHKSLSLEYYDEVPKGTRIIIDPEKFRMAVQNLLDNAFKYTPAGGKVVIKASTDPNQLFLQISDTGVGIPDDQKEKIFSKFFRAANVVKLQTEGSGLGLFIVKSIIERHHGTISYISEEGHGTTFTLTLPLPKQP